MKFRATLILLALTIGLGVFLLITALRMEKHPAPDGGTRVFAPDASAEELLGADSIEIVREGMHLRLLRDGDGLWRAVYETYDTPADQSVVAKILLSLGKMPAMATITAKPGKPLNLASYGLVQTDPHPQYLTVSTGARKCRLFIGKLIADEKGVYVLDPDESDDTVHVASRLLLDLVRLAPWDFRDKAMLPGLSAAGPETANGLTINVPGRQQVACRLEESWRLAEPLQDAADEQRVSRFIAGLALLKFTKESFVGDFDTPPERFGFDAPKARIAVRAGDKEFTLLIGNEHPEGAKEFFAKSPGESAVFRLDAGLVKALMLKPSDIRSREAIRFSPLAVNGIAIQARRESVRLARQGNAWAMTEPAGQTPDASFVQSFLAELRALRIEDWIDDPTDQYVLGLGLKHPTRSVTLFRAGAPDLRIDFGDEDTEGMLCHARINGTGPILLVPSAFPRILLAGGDLFLPRLVLDFDPADVAAIVVEHGGDSLRIARTESRWSSSSPEAAAIDDALAKNLLWTLCHLQSKRLVIENPADVAALYGLQPPRAKIAIQWKRADAAPATLLIGKEADKGELYVMVPGEARVHVASDAVLEKAAALLEYAENRERGEFPETR